MIDIRRENLRAPLELKQNEVDDYIVHDLAHIEMALAQGIKLQITPAQIVSDIGRKQTLTRKYFASFVDFGSLTSWAFVED